MKNKQILKKALSITLCAVLLGGTAAALPSIVPDIGIEADAAVYGDYEYQELSDGSIRITKYNGTASSITIPQMINGKYVRSIEGYAFNQNTSLTTISIPATFTEINPLAFYGCYGLKTVNIPSTVRYIGSYAFEFCDELETINGAANVIGINNGAFWSCTKLKSITFGVALKSIGSYAFINTGLTSVELPPSVNSIGDNAFGFNYNNSTYTKVDGFKLSGIPSSAAETYASANDLTFEPTLTYKEFADGSGVSIKKYTGSYTTLIIPDKIKNKPVVKIETFAFDDSNVETVALPSTMTSVSQYAFYDCTSLRNVTIPSSITSIGNYAFTNCTNLSNVNIGGTLTSIGAGAFRNCPLITSFDFKKGLTTIGYGAFAGTGLSNASLPISLTSLSTYSLGYDYKNGDYTKKDTFTMSGYSGEAMNYATKNGFDFTNLLEYKTTDEDSGISIVKYKGKDTEFEIPEEIDGKPVVSIEKNAFNGNVTLKKVILPESMTSVPAYSFYGCYGLEEVVLSDSIKSIQTYAFEFCDKLTTINLDETPLKTIGPGAFWGCKALEEVSLPAGLENICDYAFCNSGLYSITLPGTIKYMGDHALGYNYKDSEYIKISTFKIYGYNGKASEYAKNNSITFYEIPDSELYNYQVNSDSSLVITHYNGSGLNVTVPETINGNTLYSLGSEAFFNNKYITSVTVPGVVTNWGDYVFGNCESLTSAAISDGCKDLGYSTFTGCTSLESVYLSNDLTSVPDYTFAGCTSLKSVNIPSNAEFIGNGAFNGCTSLESIVFPEGISKIYSYAFFGCTSLKSIALPKDLKTIDQSAFSGCSGLTNIEIPEGVTEIDDSAFGFCGLESVSIPASVTWIGDYAFEGNEGMTIYGVTGSAAETYANNNGFTFVGKSSEPLANKSTISSENINLGKKVTLTAIAEGGSEPYTYAFMYRQSGTSSWKTLGTKYGTESVKTFKPTATGAYDILITVKDSSGKTDDKKMKLVSRKLLENIEKVGAK